MTTLSNTLADLAERVKNANEAVLGAQRTTAEKALEAGHLLVEAKAGCAHGQWRLFLNRGCINERTARNFMTLARSGLNRPPVAELGGIKAALAFISKWRMPSFDEMAIIAERSVVEPVRLLCDSQYVVKGCNDWRHGWKRKGWKRGPEKPLANAALWRELDEALTLVPIELEWVRGHAGIVGNERADELSLIGREKALQERPLSALEQQLSYEVS